MGAAVYGDAETSDQGVAFEGRRGTQQEQPPPGGSGSGSGAGRGARAGRPGASCPSGSVLRMVGGGGRGGARGGGEAAGERQPFSRGSPSVQSASLELRSREEKDAELDKRIEALRRKNQALIRRYQEIEEDRRKAEREGVAVTGARKARSAEAAGQPERRRVEPEAAKLAGRVPPAPEDRRPLGRKAAAAARGGRGEPQPGGRPPRAEAGWAGPGADGDGGGPRGRGERGRRPRGRADMAGGDRRSQEWEERRRRNIEQMNEEMEKIAEYERGQRDGLQEKNPVRNFLDDPRRSGAFSEAGRQEGSRRHVRNWGGSDFDKVKTGLEPDKEPPSLGRGSGRRRGPKTTLDMTLSMTGRERAEYTRWKQEREQIDRDRLARHRQPTGEWRREWDAEKTDLGLKEGSKPRGSLVDKEEHSKHPPKLPTFGEFTVGPPGDRHRKIRGHGRRRGSPPKSYSMHDNRWEKEEADRTLPASAGEDKAKAASVLQTEPQIAVTEEDEEEDEWEDVSEEEEEEEAEANSSQDSSSEEDGPRPSCSPLPPRKPRQQPTLRSASLREAATMERTPMTPLGPAEGYEPVSDWGEEMEMCSPRASHSSQSPLAVPREDLPAGIAGIGPLVPLAVQGSLPMDSPAGGAASAASRALEAEIKMDAEMPEPKEVACQARWKKGEHLEIEAPEAAP
ncbi:coiled-coil domain-containing protein 9 isoform X1 [Ahaetulla prasina]|uniref:coiled-coil domain-containing protein 9 isoform X1 n=1 Tax=Ahaetulla prasina TaxID=499056 RepID=UPI002649B4E2|nr:coiled-coil domain-containing protein 9 isoform X1 [Ahaetulla prasina]